MTILAFILVALGGALVGSTVAVVIMGAMMEARIADIIHEKDRFNELQSKMSILHRQVHQSLFEGRPNAL